MIYTSYRFGGKIVCHATLLQCLLFDHHLGLQQWLDAKLYVEIINAEGVLVTLFNKHDNACLHALQASLNRALSSVLRVSRFENSAAQTLHICGVHMKH